MRELKSIVDTSSVTSVQVLAWARRVEAQRAQTTLLDIIKETRDFNAIMSQKNRTKSKGKYTGKTKYRPPPSVQPMGRCVGMKQNETLQGSA